MACGTLQAADLAPTQDIFAGLDVPTQDAAQPVAASGAVPAVKPVEPIEPGESDGTLPAPPAPPVSRAADTGEDDSDGSYNFV